MRGDSDLSSNAGPERGRPRGRTFLLRGHARGACLKGEEKANRHFTLALTDRIGFRGTKFYEGCRLLDYAQS